MKIVRFTSVHIGIFFVYQEIGIFVHHPYETNVSLWLFGNFIHKTISHVVIIYIM